MMKRKRLLRRIPSPPVTSEMASYMKRMRAEGLYVHQIAAELGVNPGRVSEVLTGKRFPKEPPSDPDQIPFDFG